MIIHFGRSLLARGGPCNIDQRAGPRGSSRGRAVLGLSARHFGEATVIALAVGTAQASILAASLTAASAHWRAGTIKELPGQLSPAIVGALASAVGVGGRTLSTTRAVALRLAEQAGDRRRHLVQPGDRSAVFLTHDHGAPGRPLDVLGDVALFCVAALSPPALFVAPLAARWSARAAVSRLRRLFAPCLAVIAVRLLLRR
jgi:uncharacterized membrane protein YfcA